MTTALIHSESSSLLFDVTGYLVVMEAGEGIEVTRSWLLKHTDPMYAPVLELVEERGLSLVSSLGPLDDGFMVGLIYTERYE